MKINCSKIWHDGAWPAAQISGAITLIGVVGSALSGDLIGTEAWLVQLTFGAMFVLFWLLLMIFFLIWTWRDRRR